MKALAQEQVDRYRHDGFLFPLPALDAEEAHGYLGLLDRIEAHAGSSLSLPANGQWRSSPHIYLPEFDRLVRDPRILDVIEDLLGPDLLVFTSTFFIKEAGSATFAAWHQDSTYFGLAPHEHVTAWLALSDASAQAGCMEVLSSHGQPRQMHHAAARLANSINGAGQAIVEPLDDSQGVLMELKAGEFSLHNTLCPHRSSPNRSSHRRVGFGISYIPAHVTTVGSHRLHALLVRGQDKWGHFDLLPPPDGAFTPAGLAMQDAVYRRYREHYREQERRHDELFGKYTGEVHAAVDG
ncbi:phytanoyl-CoA dioxygenase family protein [Pigmentiphaga soli]|uniref:Phytanoyl-CoA dioxygenase family protein n=1 Tax=Pigmentiphaga soli TaxID=1007095 RepID=A0ABP8HSE4_9BURK